MTLKEVRFNLTHHVEHDTHKDKKAGATEELSRLWSNAHQAADDGRHDIKSGQENRTSEGKATHGEVEEVCCRLAWADAWKVTTTLFEIFRDLCGLEHRGHPEVAEEEDQSRRDTVVDPARADPSGESLHPAHVREHGAENLGREKKDGLSKDDRHDTGIVHFQRQILSLAAINFTTNHTLGILNHDATCRLSQGNDASDHDDHESKQHDQLCWFTHAFDIWTDIGLPYLNQGTWKIGNDVHADQDGNTVADATLGDHFTQPHHEHGASCDGDDCGKDETKAIIWNQGTTQTINDFLKSTQENILSR